ncbi:alpha/beta hydrolase family protein [Dyadobacter psychrotolerans]|uniref:Acylamino acid-releasing protein n=1 Tax=Dyadobacter psychrotolerans TaxID=2541721 RepID=A0A4R5DTP4_9BACT|nr:acetylxylan esterase [Dyadobacter psychrotolerans]TDE14515.1 acylamino acid-releasing protein [Dyadobacter psychrotolerans]
MKKLVILLLLISLKSFSQNTGDLMIDQKPIKTDSLLWDLQTLSKAPEVQWIDKTSKVYSLIYNSVDFEGKPTQVFAYYSNPDILAGKPVGSNKFPGVVLIHGGGGQAFKAWVEKWASEGYAAIAMDLSGNGADGKKVAQPGPEQSHENKFDKIEKGNLKNVWTYHAVASSILAHSLLLSFSEIDKSKTCLTGISWGGYLTCIVGSLDNRFKAAVPVYGCGYYDESDVFKEPLNQLTANGKRRWMYYFDPSVYMPFAKTKFCFLNGNKDKFYNVVPYSKTYHLVKEKRRKVVVLPDMRHDHVSGWEPKEIRYFFESVINKTAPIAKVGKPKSNKSRMVVSYKSEVPLVMSEFYFSNDTVSSNEKRVWIKQEATIETGKRVITTSIPKDNFKYGFFYLKDRNGISASSEFIIH